MSENLVRGGAGSLPPGRAARLISLADLIATRADESIFNIPRLIRRPRVTAVRPADLVVLAFEFRNLSLRVEEGDEGPPVAFLVPADRSKQAYLTVHLQPQNIAEQAFFEQVPAIPFAESGDRESKPGFSKAAPSPGALPVRTRIAGPSTLVFKVPATSEPIPYSIEGILGAIRGLELSLPVTALPPEPPTDFWLPDWVHSVADVVATGVSVRTSAMDLVRTRARLQRWEDMTDILPVTIRGQAGLLSRSNGGAEQRAVTATGGPALAGTADGGLARRLPATRTVAGPLRGAQVREILEYLRIHPRLAEPGETETALELPFRLILAPNRYAAWSHAPLPVSSPATGRTELWHTRLGRRVETEDGIVVDEEDHALRTVRAVWARSGSTPPQPNQRFSTNPANRPEHSTQPFRTSLDAADRFDIVHLSANFNLPKQGMRPRYRPAAIDVDRLMLSALGGWIDTRGQWKAPPPPLAVEEWRHRGTAGRDHYVRVVYKGYLWPFGHRASLIKVTERKFHSSLTGLQGNPAILRQRMFLVVRQPVLAYGDPRLKNAAGHRFDHQFPFTQVRITTLVTPDLDPPNTKDEEGKAQALFWPYVGGTPFPFHVVAEDLEGRRIEFTAPLLFVSNAHAFDEPILKAVKQRYESAAGAALHGKVRLNGQRVALAPAGEPGDTMFEAEELELGVELPSATDLGRLGPDRARFYPRVCRARIVIPAIKQFTGNSQATVVEFATSFLTAGFPEAAGAHANAGQVFLRAVAGQRALDFSGGGDRAGAFVQPNLNLAGISRSLGPVGGDLATLASGSFTPQQFFDSLTARLFGVIDLGEVIKAANVDAADLVPRFVTEAIAAVDAFAKELTRLQARVAALKAQADTATTVAAAELAKLNQLQSDVAAHVTEVATAIDGLLSGDDAVDDLATAIGKLHGDLDSAQGLIGSLAASVSSEVRKSLQATIDALTTDIGGQVADFVDFAQRLKSVLQLPEELTMRFDWRPQVQHWPNPGSESDSLFRAANTRSGAPATLTIAAELQAKSKLRSEPRIDVACRLHNFTLNLIGEQSFLLLHFNKLEFGAVTGSKPDVNLEFDGIEFTGVLSFVETLRTLIPLDGFSDPPALDVSEQGIKASYSMALPDLAVGVFSLQNVSLGAGFSVPFLLKPLSVRFNFSERESPFLVTVSMFGGGGFFAITVDPDGVQILEAAFEFGASLSVNLGVASGGVTVMAGIYYRMEVDEATLAGYFRMAGRVSVLGLISACIELYLALAYEFASGKCAGRATITVEVSIAFFSKSVSISCERKFAGSNGDPTFEQLMGPGPDLPVDPWLKYCEAFA